MLQIFKGFSPLFIGIILLMMGNGLQATLVGVRGAIEGFSPFSMSIVLSGYFIGYLIGARITPFLIRNVGHVRVFTAYASIASACLLFYSVYPNQILWFGLRIAFGTCIVGCLTVSEGWLNNASPNETRGQTLSIYLMAQLLGYVISQGTLNVTSPFGYGLFIFGSAAMSLSLIMLVLSPAPAPAFETTKPMKLSRLFQISPFSMVGVFLMGGMFAALFGLGAVYGTEKGLPLSAIGIFIAAIYIGGLVVQYPIGWLSDRMDRRRLIVIVVFIGAAFCFFGAFAGNDIVLLSIVAFVMGAAVNPLYTLYIAHTNDRLEFEEMAAACGGLSFVNGCGAITGSVGLGWIMTTFGVDSYFLYVGALLALSGLFGLYSMTRKGAKIIEDRGIYHNKSAMQMGTSAVVLAGRARLSARVQKEKARAAKAAKRKAAQEAQDKKMAELYKHWF